MNRRKQRKNAAYLDAKLPLAGASHADVERSAGQFSGWSGDEHERSFLFDCEGCRVVINTLNGTHQLEDPARANGVRKFVARDGSLFFVRRWGRELANAASERISNYALPAFEPAGATI